MTLVRRSALPDRRKQGWHALKEGDGTETVEQRSQTKNILGILNLLEEEEAKTLAFQRGFSNVMTPSAST
jgi:hypothetical protein